jgi:YjbE family integral membrane protein
VALRILFTFIVSRLLGIPLLTLAGGIFVVVLAIRLPAQGSENNKVDAQPTLLKAVLAIIAADVFMSLDNVLALAAASKGSLWLIVFGLLTSAPLVVFGAHVLSSLMNRFPILVWGGAMVLGWAGGELIAADPAWTALGPSWRPTQPLFGALASTAVLAWALVIARRNDRPGFVGKSE